MISTCLRPKRPKKAVMAAILARIILGERPARIWYPATGLALAGLVLLNLGSSQDTSTAALLLPLLAGACYGAYFVFSKPLGRTHAPEHIMLLLCAGSGILLLPVHFCTPPLWLLHPQGMGMALYLGVVTAALGKKTENTPPTEEHASSRPLSEEGAPQH